MSAMSAGIDLRRPKSVGGVIADALRCYRSYPTLFASLTLAVVVPYGLIVWLVEDASLIRPGRHAVGGTLAALLLDMLLVAPLISALHIHALVDIGSDQEPKIGRLFARGVRVVPVVAAAALVAGLCAGLGLVALIIPGVMLFARWGVVAQTAAIEDVNWRDALSRSARLTSGHYWHVLGVLVTIGVINTVIQQVCGALVGPGADPLQVLIGIAVDTIVLSAVALTTAMLYYDLKARSA